MTFLDWSDPDGMFDLLIEFIQDERNASSGDRNRQKFLTALLAKVNKAWEGSPAKSINNLRAIQDSVDDEFKADPVFSHLTDFIDELERNR